MLTESTGIVKRLWIKWHRKPIFYWEVTRVGLLLDESGFEKKGEHSVGVARQWNGRLGKVDNCQVGVLPPWDVVVGHSDRFPPLSAGTMEQRGATMRKVRDSESCRHFKIKSELAWKWLGTNVNRAFILPGWVPMAVTEKNRPFCGDW